MIAMLLASGVFLAAVVAGKGSFDAGNVETGPYVLTIAAYVLLVVGGWLGGSVVFVHGMRVLNLVDEPARRRPPARRDPGKARGRGRLAPPASIPL